MSAGCRVGAMDSYSHGKGLKSQLTKGVGLAIRFPLSVISWNSNSSDIFLEFQLWRTAHQHRPQDLVSSCPSSPPSGRLVPTFPAGGPSMMAYSCLYSPLQDCKTTGFNFDCENISSIPDCATCGNQRHPVT